MKDSKTGRVIRPDAVSPRGHPVELKPNTATGRAKGRKQLPGQERARKKRKGCIF